MLISDSSDSEPYLGEPLGAFRNGMEGISGSLFMVDQHTVFLRDLVYEGDDDSEKHCR